mgnify:CR=1 FL=1
MTKKREELIHQYLETKDKKIKDAIVLAYNPLIEYIAKKLSFESEDVPDLIQVGHIGLLKCLDGFDTSRKLTFATYVSSNIIGEIRHYLRDKGRIVRLPRKLQEQFSKIRQFIKIKTQELNRFPTTSEIAKGLKISEEDVLESMEAGHSFRVISLDRPVHANKNRETSEKFSLIDNIGSAYKEDTYFNKELLKTALENLNEREKKIIYLRFYEGLTQKEIADRLTLSQMHVSRLLQETLQKLKRRMKKDI